MGQWLSWLKSNDKEILTILENLSKKAVEVSEELVKLFSNICRVKQNIHHSARPRGYSKNSIKN
jgi:hypothetical protein